MKRYSISELAKEAGVTPRTIRFYAAEGLLPPPDSRGRYAQYGQEHLERLRQIQRLKEAFLPLHAIRAFLERSPAGGQEVPSRQSADEVGDSALFEITPAPVSVPETAADYIRRVTEPLTVREIAPPAPASPPSSFMLRARAALGDRLRKPEQKAEQWERILIADGVELHVRAPRTPETQKLIHRLMESIK